jgi:hypothetical protein
MNEILKIPFAVFNNNWDDLQLFLKHRGNPPYEITDDLNLSFSKIESLGNLTSVGGDLNLRFSEIKSLGNLTSVGGDLFLSKSKIESLGNLTSVGGRLYLGGTPLSNKYCEEEIRKMVEVGGWVYI